VVVLTLLLAACGGAGAPSSSPAAPASAAAASAKPASSAGTTASGQASSQAAAASKPAPGAVAKPSGQLASVTVGGLTGTPDRALWIGQDKGFYTQQGVNPDVSIYKGFGEMLPLLATGKLDVGVGGISPGFFNALLSGVNVKVVADSTLIADPPPGKHMSYGLLVRKDLQDQVKTVADMKGRSIAVNGVQGIGELQLDAILHLGNLTTADVDVESIPFPDAFAALGNKKIDGALEVEPFVTLAIQQNVAFPLADLAKAMPNSPAQWVFYSTEFIKNRPDAGKRFLAGYTQAMRLNSDALFKDKGRDAVIQMYINHTQAKDPKAYDQQTPAVDETNARINLQALQQAEDYFVAHGWQKSKIDVNSVVDTSFGEYVRQTLGTYS
jgi:NitT/TauT family transport system substrate-binding protein